jgi:hypothetical protein
MERWIETATPQQKQRAASVSFPSSQDGPSLSMENVRQITENPMQSLAKSLRSAIRNKAADFANPDAFADSPAQRSKPAIDPIC